MNGIVTIAEFLSPAQERELIERIDNEPQESPPASSPRARSRVYRYGWSYNPANKWLRDIPGWLSELALWLPGPRHVNQVTINVYEKGNSIAPHVDSLEFTDTISVVSLGGEARMSFFNGGNPIHAVDLMPRSAIVLSGVAREIWAHGIEPVARTRYSIVFREKKQS